MKKQQAGMTLIELVIVIIVLGIIAAVAGPKFVDIKSDAEVAAQEGFHGNMLSAYTLATAAARGTPDFDGLIAKSSDMTCTIASSLCDSADFNKDAGSNPDISYTFYQDNLCATAATAGAHSIGGYKKNSAVDATDSATGTCVALN